MHTTSILKSALCLAPLCLLAPTLSAQAAQADGHAPAGVMFDHAHREGEFMFGYNAQRVVQDGAYYQGSKKISESSASEALGKYAMLADKHDMVMHMLHFMYAPTDRVTLSLMPMYMTMDMDMRANPYQVDSGIGHGGMGHGDMSSHMSHSHGVSGLGDTLLGVSYRVLDEGAHQVLTTLAISAPTGDFSETGADGKPVHYGMQLGAGVWQVLPSVTYKYSAEPYSAGAQISTRQPIGGTNNLGYYKGDEISSTAWLSYLWNPAISSSVRLQYSKTDTIQGHYEVPHNHSAPADFQGNYGGEQILAGVGINTVIPATGGLRLGAEYLIPINESLNGVQQQTRDVLNASISKAF